MVGFGQQRLAMPLTRRAAINQLDCLVGQVEQTDGVGEVRVASAESFREFSRPDVEVVEQDGDGSGFFDRGEVLADDILD